ncbi:NAD-dependent epimerase/dehydratase [Streptomyces sp. NPDC020875]|uniref:NAD-dependent epimerase/dehydratase family protein n=1 Tax=Streptomyces sp. NPDC020875 TaxID=3154898 RepID=UPI0033F14DE3
MTPANRTANTSRTASAPRATGTERAADTERPGRTVVVLGASGFLGGALTGALARRPGELRLVARRPTPVPAGSVAEVRAYRADLTEPDPLGPLVADADVVFQLVAHTDNGWRVADGDPVAEAVNVGTTRRLVAALRERPAGRPPPVVVFAGTTSQSGPTGGRPLTGAEPDRPVTAYCRQKLAAERLLKDATAEGVLRAVSLRLPTVYGPGPAGSGVPRGVVAAMAASALAGRPLTIWGDGSVLRDLLHADDVVSAFLLAADHAGELAGRHWPVGTGHGMSLRALFSLIAEVVAEHTGRPPVPVVRVDPPAGAVAADTESVRVDAGAFRSRTGWTPVTDLRAGVRETVARLAAEFPAGADGSGPRTVPGPGRA